ncbi:MAG: hypothetical protein IJO22_06640 [Oscillospiraceae bacterium]|nr:hypothetical protein [Oscillospiraceae bacterium]
MNFVSIIYDILAIFIVINCIKKGTKNGFAKTAVQTIGYICAIIAALVISRMCAAIIYTTAIQPAVISNMESSIANAVDAESVVNGLTEAVESLPAISHILFDFSGAVESLVASVGLNFAEIAAAVEESVVRPVVEPILETVIFAFSLIILATVVSIIAKGSKIVNEVPVLGGINSFFGGVFGIANGVLELCIGAFILELIISASLFPEYFSEEIVEKTFFFRLIYFSVCGSI